MTARKQKFDAAAAQKEKAALLGQRLHTELLKEQPVFKRLLKLIESGADLEARNQKGETTLMVAIKRKNLNAVQLLINGGANVNTVDNDNRTPLYHAVNTSNLAIMRPLFAMNAPEGFITDSLIGQDRWDDYLWSLKEKIAKQDAEMPIRLMKKLHLNGKTPPQRATTIPVMNKLKLKG